MITTDQRDFVERQGLPYLAHLLRRLSDELVREFEKWSPEAALLSPTRTRTTLLALDEHGALGVTEVAALIRQSAPLVFTWVRQLKSLDLVVAGDDPADRRRSVLSLTPAGQQEVARLKQLHQAMAAAYEELLSEAGADIGLFDSLWRMERACRDQPFASILRKHVRGSRAPEHPPAASE